MVAGRFLNSTCLPIRRYTAGRLHQFDESGRCLVLAHSSRTRPPRLLLDLEPDAPIATGDRLVVMARPGDFQRLLNHDSDDLSDVLWAGRIRRFSRVAYRTLSQMDLAVKVCAATLLVVVTTSTTIYHFGLGYGWANSLYHTISVVSTGADLGGQQYEGWGQVFVSGLKMFGTILVAAFTAIFTNFLLRARLGGALEVRRIPDSGHMVVIGLGNVGYRVVEELVHQGEQVVVVEQKADSPFIPTCRRTGVPVIVGDATIRETLLQARVKEARAVIAATSSDLVNLEVALLVAELNEQQRSRCSSWRFGARGDGAHRGRRENGSFFARTGGAGIPGRAARRSRPVALRSRRSCAGRGGDHRSARRSSTDREFSAIRSD